MYRVALLAVAALCAAAYGETAAAGNDLDTQAVLDRHNHWRRITARGEGRDANGTALPPAADMKLMQWDASLAADAQSYANKCLWQHDMDELVAKAQGENLAYASWHDPVGRVDRWYHEIDRSPGKLGGTPTEPFSWHMYGTGAGHYTQLVWAATDRVGCGYILCEGWWYYLVCRYANQGNVIGLPMYKEGPACSSCPDSCDNQLCM